MKIQELVRRFEAEAEKVRGQISGLEERAAFLDEMLKELKGATRGGRRTASRSSGPSGRRASGGRKRGRPTGGGVTVKDAILKAVSSSSEPMTAGEIIAKAKEVSGGAENSIRTQINNLARAGHLARVAYEGRGFKYRLGSA